MINYSEIQTYPELVDVLKHIDERVAAASCPPDQEIWDNKMLCEALNISIRTAATWRKRKFIPYHKIEGIIFYLKSDVLDLLKKNRIESIGNKVRIKTKIKTK